MVLEGGTGFSEGSRKLIEGALLVLTVIRFLIEAATLPLYALYDICCYFNRRTSGSGAATKSLENEIILVTGGGSGIGREICYELASQDNRATIISWDVNEAGNLETYNALLKMGVRRAFTYTVDIASPDQVEAGASKIREEVGDVTILFNNAGISVPLGSGWKNDPVNVRKVLEVNTLGHCWTLKGFLPQMIKSGRECSVVETISLLAFICGPLGSAYTASKFAMRGYMECVKEDLRREGVSNVHVSLVFPHFVTTPLTAGLGVRSRKYPFLLEYLDPKDVASKMVAGMLSQEEYIYVPEWLRFVHLLTNIATPSMARKLVDMFNIEGNVAS